MSYIRITKPMHRALAAIVRNRTLGARNPFHYNVQTRRALVRRGLVVFRGNYIVPTRLGVFKAKLEEL